jgi:two-component system, OmpR family, response regulator
VCGYIVKPFGLREILARVRAVLLRQGMGRVAQTRDPERGGYRFGGWQLERRGRRLVDPNGAQVSLSKGEYALLLAFFLEAPRRPLTRAALVKFDCDAERCAQALDESLSGVHPLEAAMGD